ncbi:LysR family transcriptional regulator, partial [Enterobacter genomosp. O]|uniref:LysR family transcriptional regulator n=1 Tax=Enterobacter genomosp. O TaxID=2364150 RepID=UPI003D6FA105
MDIDLILTLDALLQDRNITHAAARLGISQPAMSARLARLRSLFGEPLFIPSPHGRGVLPTPRAEALRPQVESVLRGISAGFSCSAITKVRLLVCASNAVGANIALMPRNTLSTCGLSASALGVGNTPRP